MRDVFRFDTISEFHRFANLPKPEHPLVSMIDYNLVRYPADCKEIRWVQSFYSIGLKRNVSQRFNYGQQEYDFDEGVLAFVSPQQILRIEINQQADADPSGWLLLVHPDFLWKTSLAKTIRKYEFFGYSVNEALFLSEKEQEVMVEILRNIQREYQSKIDKFSQNIIVTQIELLLNYAERYYERQFITRRKPNHQLLNRLEAVLDSYFDDEVILEKGLPSVEYIAGSLNLSANYLSSMLKVLTGQSTQQHIQNKLVEKAKEKLSASELSISEIAFGLGFEHSSSFSKLFKSKTSLSPLEFRKSFN